MGNKFDDFEDSKNSTNIFDKIKIVKNADKTKFCSNCGEKIDVKAEICPTCGVRVAPLVEKSPQGGARILLYIISFFVPIIGSSSARYISRNQAKMHTSLV